MATFMVWGIVVSEGSERITVWEGIGTRRMAGRGRGLEEVEGHRRDGVDRGDLDRDWR